MSGLFLARNFLVTTHHHHQHSALSTQHSVPHTPDPESHKEKHHHSPSCCSILSTPNVKEKILCGGKEDEYEQQAGTSSSTMVCYGMYIGASSRSKVVNARIAINITFTHYGNNRQKTRYSHPLDDACALPSSCLYDIHQS